MESPRRVVLAFTGAVLIGGANFVAVKFSNEGLPPLLGAGLRFACAAVPFFVLAALRRAPRPSGHAAFGAALYGVLGFGLAYGLMYYGLVGLPAGLVSTIAAAVPLVTLVLAVLHRQEAFTLRGVVGGGLAVVGIGVLSWRAVTGEVRPTYLVAVLLAVFAIAESTVVVKGFPRAHPFLTNGIGMATGSVLLVLGSLATGEAWSLPRTTKAWLAVLWLVVVGSVGLFALFLYVIARWTASASTYALALMPVVTVTLGVLLADERVTWQLVVGGSLVLLAVYVGALSRESPASPVVAGTGPAASDRNAANAR